MLNTRTTIVIVGLLGSLAQGDSPAPPVPFVFTSEYPGDVVFTLVPPIYGPEPDYKVVKEATGVAYRLATDGTLKELYRTTGWYSFRVHVSRDGKYLVQMGPWSSGSEVSKDDLAVAFHRDGKLIKSYSTADLIKDPSKLHVSVSHYQWLRPYFGEKLSDAEVEELRPRLDYENKFTLNTIDGQKYVFDVTTGKITSNTK